MKKRRLERYKSGKQFLAHARRSENYSGEKVMDYMLAFDNAPGAGDLSEQADQIIAIVERTQSSIGGGYDLLQGEYYLEASSRFEKSHLLEIVGMLLPAVTSLTIKPVNPVQKLRRRTVSMSSNKKANGARNVSGNGASSRKARKQRERA